MNDSKTIASKTIRVDCQSTDEIGKAIEAVRLEPNSAITLRFFNKWGMMAGAVVVARENEAPGASSPVYRVRGGVFLPGSDRPIEINRGYAEGDSLAVSADSDAPEVVEASRFYADGLTYTAQDVREGRAPAVKVGKESAEARRLARRAGEALKEFIATGVKL